MTIRMSGEERFTTMPSRLTASGSWASAWLTRFCVLTCMMSTSVPTSKYTLSVILPSLALNDCM